MREDLHGTRRIDHGARCAPVELGTGHAAIACAGWVARPGALLSVLVALLGAGVAVRAVGAPAAARVVEVTTRARALQPGEAVLLVVRTEGAFERVDADVLGRRIALARDTGTGEWNALAGLDLDVPPGEYTIEVTATAAGGERRHASHPLPVEARVFPERQLKVDPKFVQPPRSALPRIERERAKLRVLYATMTPERLWRAPFARPVEGAAVSGFGVRSVFNGVPREPHSGADLGSPAGTPVHAPAAGRVALAEPLYFSGNTVVLDHGQGTFSLLAHLSRMDVHPGELVDRGTVVGAVGATGRVTGPHLHWGMRIGGARVDPLSVIEVLEK